MKSAFGVEHDDVSKGFPKFKLKPEGNARHDVAGQIAQESGDHTSAAWARKQQIRQSKTKLSNAVKRFSNESQN